MNMPNPAQLVIIGVAIVFVVPTVVGIVIGHFFGFWFGVYAGGALCALVIAIAHRRIVKTKQERDKEQ